MANDRKPLLTGARVTLVSLERQHRDALLLAASDGMLWELRVTTEPDASTIDAYIETALGGWDSTLVLRSNRLQPRWTHSAKTPPNSGRGLCQPPPFNQSDFMQVLAITVIGAFCGGVATGCFWLIVRPDRLHAGLPRRSRRLF